MLFPTETARWLLSHGDSKITIECARAVEMRGPAEPPVQALPSEPEQPRPEESPAQALTKLLLTAMRQSAPAGVTVEQVDLTAIQRERQARMQKLPFPVVLDAQCAADGGKDGLDEQQALGQICKGLLR